MKLRDLVGYVVLALAFVAAAWLIDHAPAP